MTGVRTILQALNSSGTSKIIKYLNADKVIPSTSKAIELYTNENRNFRKGFYTPRIIEIENGCPHFTYALPQERPTYFPLIISVKSLNNLALTQDKQLTKLCQGEEVYYDNQKQIFPYSLSYSGFQFGQFAGQLGDGRVVNLFDIKDINGIYQTLQLKGSGLTPFSRFADGKLTLKSSIKEFIMSEFLHEIGIPTMRVLQLSLLPGTKTYRSISEDCAILSRYAPSWIRLGNFDLFRWRDDYVGMIKLSNFCINEIFNQGQEFLKRIDINIYKKNFFPSEECIGEDQELEYISNITKYDLLFRHVVKLNAECVAYWQAYGFCHGVLNTDNISIMGISIDFGSSSFIDSFQPEYTSSNIDAHQRYSFSNQPNIMWWNLRKFAEAITPLIGAGEKYITKLDELPFRNFTDEQKRYIYKRAQNIINLSSNEYKFLYIRKYTEIMANRLGIDLNFGNIKNDGVSKMAEKICEFNSLLIDPLLNILRITKINYNSFFVNLQNYKGRFFDKNGINGLDEQFIRVFCCDKQLKKIKRYISGDIFDELIDTNQLIEILDPIFHWAVSYSKMTPHYQLRLKIQKKSNPLFLPTSYILDEIIEDLIEHKNSPLFKYSRSIDGALLYDLHKMVNNPYDMMQWKELLNNKTVKKWMQYNISDIKL